MPLRSPSRSSIACRRRPRTAARSWRATRRASCPLSISPISKPAPIAAPSPDPGRAVSAPSAAAVAAPASRLGLRENLGQFSLLLVINAFVGAMVGMERSILPLLAEHEFGIASRASILSFLLTFGIVKAFANAFAGGAADRWGRRRMLIAGWIAALPVPLLIIFAPSWSWVVAANVLLGVNQGLCWSAAIIMKVDLVGPKQRGLAIGLNESSGYLAVSAAALASGYLAARFGLRPEPFLLGLGAAVLGLLCSLLVRDTRGHAALESGTDDGRSRSRPSPRAVFSRVTWTDRSLQIGR